MADAAAGGTIEEAAGTITAAAHAAGRTIEEAAGTVATTADATSVIVDDGNTAGETVQGPADAAARQAAGMRAATAAAAHCCGACGEDGLVV